MLKKRTKLLSVMIICIFVLSSITVAGAQTTIQVDVNGRALALGSAQPYVSSGALMVPLKSLSEALGGNVSWDTVNKNITVLRGNNVYLLKQGKGTVYANGRAFKLSGLSVVKAGTTYVPQDFIQVVFGLNSAYDSKTSKLSIKMKSLPVYFSESFKVEYLDNGCKLVTDAENQRLLLVPQGMTAPKNVKADRIISIPVKNVMAASTTQVGPLIKLGVFSSLKAVTTSGGNWNTPAVNDAIKSGKIKYVGGEGMGEPDYEQVKAANPDLIFIYTGDYGQQSIMTKADEMGINSVVNNEYLEPHYLGRMEWVKFMGVFYDKELAAEKILNDAVKEIDTVAAKVEGLKMPKVAWGSSYKGVVNVPNAGSYIAKWIDIAGGDYVFKNVGAGQTNTSPLSMEEFYAKAKEADTFVYASSVNYMANPTIEGIVKDNPLFADIKAVKDGNVYAYSPDWWETIPESDLFVKSVAGIFHPEAFKGYTPTKLVKLPRK